MISNRRISRYIEWLTDLPPEAPEWTTLASFLKTATDIATEKLRQQKEAGTQLLRDEIERLGANHSMELQALELECGHWDAKSCLPAQAAIVASQVALLRSNLTSFLQLDQAVLPATLPERQALRKKLTEVEAGIKRLYETLNPIFSQPPDPPHTSGPAPNEGTSENPSVDPPPLSNDSDLPQGLPPADPAPEGDNSDAATAHSPPQAPVSDPPPRTPPPNPPPKIPIKLPNGPATHVKVAPRFQLSSVGEVAYRLYAEDSGQHWEELLYALIGSDDLPGAYWLSRSLTERGWPVSIPHTMIGVMQAALWLESADDPLWLDLFDAVSDPGHEKEDPVLKLAIGLNSCLIAPESGMAEWLKCPPEFPEMSGLVSALKSFAAFQMPFVQERLISAVAPVKEKDFDQLSSQAAKWLEAAPTWKTNLEGANDVWRDLIGNQGAIRLLVEPVSRGDRLACAKLRSAAREWQETSKVEKKINQLFRSHSRLSSSRNPRIIGGRMEQIVRHINQAVALALSWCDLVDREKAISNARTEEDVKRAIRLVQQVEEALPAAERALASVTPTSLRAASSAHCLERSFEKLRALLKLSEGPTQENEFNLRRKPSGGLGESLSRRLLWCPEIECDEEGQPLDLEAVAEVLRYSGAAGTTLQTAWPDWIKAKDFRSVEAILSELQTPALQRQYEEALRRARDELTKEHAKLFEAVEQSLMDGAIAEEHSEFTAILQGIEPEQLVNLRPATRALQALRDDLAAAKSARLNHLQEKWGDLEPRLRSRHGLPQAECDVLCEFVEQSIAEKDLRILDECLAGVNQILETEGEIASRLRELPWAHKSNERDVLAEYMSVIANLEDRLNAETDHLANFRNAVMKGQNPVANLGLSVPQNRRSEVSDTIAAWLHLQGSGPRGTDAPRDLWTILRFLGFQPMSEDDPPISIMKAYSDWVLARANVSAGEAARPIWQLGSACMRKNDKTGKYEGNYHVLCFWGNPGVKQITACVDQLALSDKGLLIIYLGYFLEAQRTELAALSRKDRLAHATLDENLLVFLSCEPDHRLPAFFRCSLPFSGASPYTPQLRGKTYEEMFFGRQDMIREIWDPMSSCIIYGGRQLGKSAMQRQVLRKYHRPEQHQYVWLKTLGEQFGSGTAQRTDAIWGELRNSFQDAGLLSSSTDDPRKIAENIQKFMLSNSALRVLVMFDEADDFLDADAADRFHSVRPLRDLMLNTDRRFKVVFAGNRHVQRFLDRPDQPFIQFGTPQLVGPMDPGAARDLVRSPLEALGYRLDDSTVLRILSYTNYHAVLIHVFCEALLERLRRQQKATLPPYEILREDVEAIYRDPHVRGKITEQFEATLALEDDYRVIAWLLIRDQMQIRDSYAAPYSAGEILDLARDGWPLGFQSYGLDLMQVRLSEMCGLGVLVKLSGTFSKNLDGCYRLRSPNLVRMMGTEDDIKRHLEAQRGKPREAKSDLESQHAWTGKKGGINQFSPLTIAQERSLNRRQTGVGLVFASEALGLRQLSEVFQRFIPKNLPGDVKAVCAEIPSEVSTSSDLQQWLKEFWTHRRSHERLVVHQRLPAAIQDLAGYVEASLDFCGRLRSPNRWLRVLLVLDPEATWRWVSLPREVRDGIETRADCSIQARRWNLTGIRQLVSQTNKLFLEDVCRDLLEKTGGWPPLLHSIFTECGEDNDPRPSADRISEKLKSPSDDLGGRLWESLGINSSSVALRIFRWIQNEKEVPVELLVPEFFDGISANDCQASLEFLLRLNCVEIQADIVRPEAIVGRLNPTYAAG